MLNMSSIYHISVTIYIIPIKDPVKKYNRSKNLAAVILLEQTQLKTTTVQE